MKTPIFYVPYVPFGQRGKACVWFILINKKCKLDFRLVAHEKIHIRQQREFGWLRYLIRYYFDKRFRAMVEYEAFSVASGRSDEYIIKLLARNYWMSESEARGFLEEFK